MYKFKALNEKQIEDDVSLNLVFIDCYSTLYLFSFTLH